MILSVYAHGDNLINPYTIKTDYPDDFFRFKYYRAVFDGSAAFTCTGSEEIDGGTERNGATTLWYASKNGCSITLDIDGGMPLPELADMSLTIDGLSDETINDVVLAFEKYHQTKFVYYTLSCEGYREAGHSIGVSLHLYEDNPEWLQAIRSIQQ